jgi:hypothetical protein
LYFTPPAAEELAAALPKQIPEGFDSLFVHMPESEELSPDNPEFQALSQYLPLQPFQQDYYLLDGNQVLPQYLVEFEYNPADDLAGTVFLPHFSSSSISFSVFHAFTLKTIMCNQCEQNRATVYCQSDDAYLCADCDEEIHRANKLMSRHVRRPIEEVILLPFSASYLSHTLSSSRFLSLSLSSRDLCYSLLSLSA